MIGQLCEGKLRFQYVLLRNAADRVFDSCRCGGLPGEGDLLIVEPQFIAVSQKFVELRAYVPSDIELRRIQLGFGNISLLIRSLKSERALARSRNRLAEHEHVLRLIEILGLHYRRSP